MCSTVLISLDDTSISETMNQKITGLLPGSRLYYVPMGKSYEVWALSVANHSSVPRSLTLTGYAEFTNHGNYEQDQVNLQYSLFISQTLFEKRQIIQQIHGNLDALPEDKQVDKKNVTERFFGLEGAAVSSWCGEKEHFLGKYHGYGNPQGVISGSLGNTASYNENSCGALSCRVTLMPEETVEKELLELKTYWYEKLDRLKVNTPSPEFNTMMNTWNAYNCFMTFIWSRAASFIYCGLRNGYGYRDTDSETVLGQRPLYPGIYRKGREDWRGG